jgi:hypothetical protein
MALGTMLAAATASQAADETGKWYLNPQGGYLWADDDRFVDDDYYYGLGVGKHISPKWNLEFNGLTCIYDPTIPGDSIDINAFSLDALRVFRRAERVSPFLRTLPKQLLLRPRHRRLRHLPQTPIATACSTLMTSAPARPPELRSIPSGVRAKAR